MTRPQIFSIVFIVGLLWVATVIHSVFGTQMLEFKIFQPAFDRVLTQIVSWTDAVFLRAARLLH